MTTPHLVPEFPLLQQFVRITPRPGANVPHELYAFHRHGLLASEFLIRRACTSDFEQVGALKVILIVNAFYGTSKEKSYNFL